MDVYYEELYELCRDSLQTCGLSGDELISAIDMVVWGEVGKQYGLSTLLYEIDNIKITNKSSIRSIYQDEKLSIFDFSGNSALLCGRIISHLFRSENSTALKTSAIMLENCSPINLLPQAASTISRKGINCAINWATVEGCKLVNHWAISLKEWESIVIFNGDASLSTLFDKLIPVHSMILNEYKFTELKTDRCCFFTFPVTNSFESVIKKAKTTPGIHFEHIKNSDNLISDYGKKDGKKSVTIDIKNWEKLNRFILRHQKSQITEFHERESPLL